MAGYFTVDIGPDKAAAPSAPGTRGSVNKMLTVASVNQYKGNVRIDFTLSGGITGGSVEPPYTYAFLDEDEVMSGEVTVNGTGSGTITAVGYDGEDTDTDDSPVSL